MTIYAPINLATCQHIFPVGTTVGLYPESARIAGGPPAAAAIVTAVMAGTGCPFALPNGLPDGEYVAWANVGGVDRYVRVPQRRGSIGF